MDDGDEIAWFAVENRDLGTLRAALDAGVAVSGSLVARTAQNGFVRGFELLVQRADRAALVTEDEEGATPLHYIGGTTAQAEQLARALIDAGCALELTATANDWTPLLYAAASGRAGAVLALLRCGANVSALSERGANALTYLGRFKDAGERAVVEAALLAAGATPVNPRHPNDYTCLYWIERPLRREPHTGPSRWRH
jgi:hypothetical protein